MPDGELKDPMLKPSKLQYQAKTSDIETKTCDTTNDELLDYSLSVSEQRNLQSTSEEVHYDKVVKTGILDVDCMFPLSGPESPE